MFISDNIALFVDKETYPNEKVLEEDICVFPEKPILSEIISR